MRALTVLASEHQAIEGACDLFAREVTALAGQCEIDPEALDRLIAFFEVKVDGHHQDKEERVFLPRLLARVAGKDVQTLRTLIVDHGEQRRLLAQMRNQMEGVTYGEPNSIGVLARCAHSYLRAQREHSRWETRCLFPLAARILGPQDDRALLSGFRRLDELWGTSVWDAERALAEWLEQRHSAV
jgi:hemerythrin-like domain-containing protein